MPRILDNIDLFLSASLTDAIKVAYKADFCVGYFNLRGWKFLENYIDDWTGKEENHCRLLIGMQNLPHDELRKSLSLLNSEEKISNQVALNLKKKIAEQLKEQLTLGVPTNQDEITLRKLSKQLKEKKLIVKLFLRYQLHAKLYLLYREDKINPIIGYVGSSNLTFAGLSNQGELNVDVVDYDASKKLSDWFNDRWNEKWCIDISKELADIIDNSWAREDLIPPYFIYLKIAYHLAKEARTGLTEFRLPKEFENYLFDYQVAAVKISAHHLNKRNGVLIGDVVGLGKTLMATAVARIFEDDFNLETLILCPKNLVSMWEDYRLKYRLRAKVLSITKAQSKLPKLRRFRLVIIDESHNLRNREGKRYKAIQDYIFVNESRVILLTATPYNKTFLDLSNQLRLFIPDYQDIGVKPERLLNEIGDLEFQRRYQAPVRSLSAFEKSDFPDDWRELMRLYMVRRTRSFIIENYALTDKENGRKYLKLADGNFSYFPSRIPKTLRFKIDDKITTDQYAQLYSEEVVNIINNLNLSRYGLGNYIDKNIELEANKEDKKQLDNLSRAGKRLMGFCRTNLFKRLESSGYAFLLSVERHILRNLVFIYAIENNLDLPIGSQEASILDFNMETDKDYDELFIQDNELYKNQNNLKQLKKRTKSIYNEYQTKQSKNFKWINTNFFIKKLKYHLEQDCKEMIKIMKKCEHWEPEKDNKLKELFKLINKKYPDKKIIVFSQFADTVNYITQELKKMNIEKITSVTGDTSDPTSIVKRFSPITNDYQNFIDPKDELRVIITTDILSEGQNLQDGFIVVNYDLPWAIIRLTQRAGRVDRIGQKSENIFVYSFLPAEGVERIIRLRARVRARLRENEEVVGTDEAFFEDQQTDGKIWDLYNEKSGILDEADAEVDLSSYAYQIWKDAIDEHPELEKEIPAIPSVVYSTKAFKTYKKYPEGVLLYMKTADDYDALSWIDKNGNTVTESQFEILKAAKCEYKTKALQKLDNHHELVKISAKRIIKENKFIGGQLGRPTSARFKVYNILKRYAEEMRETLFHTPELEKAMEDIYKYPLREVAKDILNRQLKSKIEDQQLVELVLNLREEGRLCIIHKEKEIKEPKIICSLGLKKEIEFDNQ